MTMHAFSTREDAAQSLAQAVAELLKKCVDARGEASLVVSGGTTPIPFFHALRASDVPWKNIVITLADERWLDVTDAESNQRLVQEHLLVPAARFVALKHSAPTLQAGVQAAEVALAAIKSPFDVVVLGMGADGHVASLFPDHPSLPMALNPNEKKRCMAIEHAPKSPPLRISLTASALSDCRTLFLHITGNDKRDVLERAMQPGPVEDMPIRAFLHLPHAPLAVYWAP